MILQPARLVVIDDDEQHLAALGRAIAELGSACLPFLYKDEHPGSRQLARARLIFCDLHLTSDAVSSDRKALYANIASMLLEGISEEHGPYVLVVWSQYGDDLETLKRYFEALQPSQRPFVVVALDKNEFIDVGTGEIREDGDLVAAVEKVIESQSGLAALLDWEEVVAEGASRTTSTLWDLCSRAEGKDVDRVLRNTLGKLARATGGTDAAKHPGHSIREALGPLLDDQIGTVAIDESRWSQAVRFGGEPSASSARLYTGLHFEKPSRLGAEARGVASVLPDAWSSAEDFKGKFGFSQGEILKSCGYRGDHLACAEAGASWYLIQIKAACDEADEDPGYLPYCLAATVPTRMKDGDGAQLKARDKRKGSVEKTREVILAEESGEWLYLFGSFVMGLEAGEVKDFEAVFRIRPSLLDKLILDIRFNSARLGAVEP